MAELDPLALFLNVLRPASPLEGPPVPVGVVQQLPLATTQAAKAVQEAGQHAARAQAEEDREMYQLRQEHYFATEAQLREMLVRRRADEAEARVKAQRRDQELAAFLKSGISRSGYRSI